MKKLLFPALLFLTGIVACSKTKTRYYQNFRVSYDQNTDSYQAEASFMPIPGSSAAVELARKESITFNNREEDYRKGNIYCWSGKGKPDANFIFHRRKESASHSINANELGTYQLVVSDVLSKSKGFTILLKGYKQTKPGFANLHFTYPGKRSVSYEMKTDSFFLAPVNLTDYYEEKMVINVMDYAERTTQESSESDIVKMFYLEQVEKEVQVVK